MFGGVAVVFLAVVISALSAPGAMAVVVPSVPIVHAPYHGVNSSNDQRDVVGCASTTTSVPWGFNLTQGVGGGSAVANSRSCSTAFGSSFGGGYAWELGSFGLLVKIKALSGAVTVRASWKATISVKLAVKPGSCHLNYSAASASCDRFAQIGIGLNSTNIADFTTGATYPATNGWGYENITSIDSYCTAPGKCTNSTQGTPGTFTLRASWTSFFNISGMNPHHMYALETFVTSFVYAFTVSDNATLSGATAAASYSASAPGTGFNLTRIEES